MQNSTKNSRRDEEHSVIRFPAHKVALNLSHQIDYSDAILLAVKQLGQVIKGEQMSDNAKEKIEDIMLELFNAGKSLSDNAYETGADMHRFAGARF